MHIATRSVYTAMHHIELEVEPTSATLLGGRKLCCVSSVLQFAMYEVRRKAVDLPCRRLLFGSKLIA